MTRRTTPPARRRRAVLSRAAILEAAVAVAQREGVDALSIRKLAGELGAHGPVLCRGGMPVRRVARGEFVSLAETGAVTEQTIVFNNTLTTVGAVRDGQWELAASDSWHAAAFFS